MPEHVVYLLGAGFSAPLGLPVMANFVSKSKDQFSASTRYAHFRKVFELFDHLAKVKAFYTTDLSNVEEILSILSIQQFQPDARDKAHFTTYLCDVIDYYTPTVTRPPSGQVDNWRAQAFGMERVHNDYGNFVLALARRGLTHSDSPPRWSTVPPDDSVPTYGVVTLNYDCVVEIFHRYSADFLGLEVPIRLNAAPVADRAYHIGLSKLHGSVADRNIVPPTWSKGSDTLPGPAWEAALLELARANHLRILGYSLPESDLNVRFLLKAAALDTFHLKTIDVICWDPTNTVQSRYDAFVDHPGYRFVNMDIGAYCSYITARASEQQMGNSAAFLELAHAFWMKR